MKKSVVNNVQHLKINLKPEHSFSVRHDLMPFFFDKLHYHPEIELVYIIKGTGKQFIGDSIHYFKSGDMILVGENTPHLWQSDKKDFSKKADSACEAYFIHFMQDCFGAAFFNLPENKILQTLLKKAKQGIRISGSTRSEIVHLMKELLNASSTKRIMLLIKVLDLIATSNHTKTICTQNVNFNASDSERINAICQYIMQHFNHKLSLKDVAEVAHLSPNAFCRYFKSRIKKSFSNFLIEVRIEHACKLLAETQMPVADVCFECGYNNFSNFNKNFKVITKKTPLQYRTFCQKENG